MKLCNDCNIVHDERSCPLCLANDRINELENTIIKMEEENASKE